jgi:hypothetical protein
MGMLPSTAPDTDLVIKCKSLSSLNDVLPKSHPPSLPHSLLRGNGVFVFTIGKVMAE